MLNKAWDLRQIDQTDDVAQKAMLRLYKTLAHVKPPDADAFYGLAARQIRWVLSDLAREMGRAKVVGYRANLPEAADPFSGPADLAEWSEFHEKIDGLPVEEREIFDLLFYEGLTQEEASAVLEMSVRSIKRRWQRARLSLAHALHGEWPRI
jgi:RNA polymerase sigma factor (sigma-70 family)